MLILLSVELKILFYDIVLKCRYNYIHNIKDPENSSHYYAVDEANDDVNLPPLFVTSA